MGGAHPNDVQVTELMDSISEDATLFNFMTKYRISPFTRKGKLKSIHDLWNEVDQHQKRIKAARTARLQSFVIKAKDKQVKRLKDRTDKVAQLFRTQAYDLPNGALDDNFLRQAARQLKLDTSVADFISNMSSKLDSLVHTDLVETVINYVVYIYMIYQHPSPSDVFCLSYQFLSAFRKDNGSILNIKKVWVRASVALYGTVISSLLNVTKKSKRGKNKTQAREDEPETGFLSKVIKAPLVRAFRNLFLSACSMHWFPKEFAGKAYRLLGKPRDLPMMEMVAYCVDELITLMKGLELMSSGVPFMDAIFAKDPLITMLKETQALVDNSSMLYVGVPVEGYMCQYEWVSTAKTMLKALDALNVNTSSGLFSDFVKKRNLLRDRYTKVKLGIEAGTRHAPLVFFIVGPPDIGKSSILAHMAKIVAKATGQEYRPGMIYPRDMTSDYWQGYDPFSMPFIHYSEPGALHVNIASKQGDPTIQEILSLADNLKKPVNTAFEDKGTVFALPKAIFLDGNDKSLNLNVIVNNPAAVRRRLITVEPKVLAKSAGSLGVKLDRNKANAASDPMDHWSFSVHGYEAVNAKDATPFVLGELQGAEEDNIFKFSTWLYNYTQEHFAKQQRSVDRLKSINVDDYIALMKPSEISSIPIIPDVESKIGGEEPVNQSPHVDDESNIEMKLYEPIGPEHDPAGLESATQALEEKELLDDLNAIEAVSFLNAIHESHTPDIGPALRVMRMFEHSPLYDPEIEKEILKMVDPRGDMQRIHERARSMNRDQTVLNRDQIHRENVAGNPDPLGQAVFQLHHRSNAIEAYSIRNGALPPEIELGPFGMQFFWQFKSQLLRSEFDYRRVDLNRIFEERDSDVIHRYPLGLVCRHCQYQLVNNSIWMMTHMCYRCMCAFGKHSQDKNFSPLFTDSTCLHALIANHLGDRTITSEDLDTLRVEVHFEFPKRGVKFPWNKRDVSIVLTSDNRPHQALIQRQRARLDLVDGRHWLSDQLTFAKEYLKAQLHYQQTTFQERVQMFYPKFIQNASASSELVGALWGMGTVYYKNNIHPFPRVWDVLSPILYALTAFSFLCMPSSVTSWLFLLSLYALYMTKIAPIMEEQKAERRLQFAWSRLRDTSSLIIPSIHTHGVLKDLAIISGVLGGLVAGYCYFSRKKPVAAVSQGIAMSVLEQNMNAGASQKRIPTKIYDGWNVRQNLVTSAHIGNVSELINVVEPNERILRVEVYDGNDLVRSSSLHGLGVSGNVILTNSHLFYPHNLTYKLRVFKCNEKDPTFVESLLHEQDLNRFGGDLVVFNASGCNFRDITTHFLKDRNVITGSTAFIAGEATRIKFVEAPKSSLCVNKIRGQDVDVITTVSSYGEYMWKGNAPGTCGIPVVIEKDRGNAIFGIHFCATDKNICSAEPVFEEQLKKAIKDLRCPLIPLMSQSYDYPVTEDPIPKSLFRHVKMTAVDYMGKLPGSVLVNQRSRLQQGPLVDDVSSALYAHLGWTKAKTYERPLMVPKMSGDTYLSPYNLFAENVETNHFGLDRELLADIVHEMIEEIAPHIPYKISPLTMDAAINGAKEDAYIRSMNMSTAAGFGLKGKKRDHATRNEEEKYVLTPEVIEQVEAIFESYLHDEGNVVIYNANLKDEPRSSSKVASGDTRIFYASPLPFLVAERMMLAPIYSLIPEFQSVFGIAIGIDMHRDADAFRKSIVDFSEYIFELDYRKFDITMCFDIRWAASYFVWYLARVLGYSEYASEMLRGVLSDALFPHINMLNDLMRASIQPSGKYGTAELNSIIGKIMLRYAFYHQQRVLGFMTTFASRIPFRTCVRDRTYGDDLSAAIAKHAISWFNAKIYHDLCLQLYGMTTTPADKGAEITEYISPENMSFLKRTFVYHEDFGRYVAPLEKESLFKMLEWYIPSSIEPLWKQMDNTLNSFSRELAFHTRSDSHHAVMAQLRSRYSEVFPDRICTAPTFEEIVASIVSN